MSIESIPLPTYTSLGPAYLPTPPPKDLPYEDGVPLESSWHLFQINLLLEVVNCRFDALDDFYAGGNMFIYYNLDQLKNQDFRGPDFFYVKGVPRRPLRKYWAIWDEGGRFPDAIIELLSPTTAKVDRTVKKDVYEQVFRTPEYFLYDPDGDRLEGWRLSGAYQPIDPNERGWLWSERLGGWIGRWQGAYQGQPATWIRIFDKEGKPWPTQAERVVQAETELAQMRNRLPQDET